MLVRLVTLQLLLWLLVLEVHLLSPALEHLLEFSLESIQVRFTLPSLLLAMVSLDLAGWSLETSGRGLCEPLDLLCFTGWLYQGRIDHTGGGDFSNPAPLSLKEIII